jgi:hypothetical protein
MNAQFSIVNAPALAATASLGEMKKALGRDLKTEKAAA